MFQQGGALHTAAALHWPGAWQPLSGPLWTVFLFGTNHLFCSCMKHVFPLQAHMAVRSGGCGTCRLVRERAGML